MTPSQLSAQLLHIAAKISNSKSPRRDLVAMDLKNLISKLATDDDVPNREPDKLDNPTGKPEDEGDSKIWYLDRKLFNRRELWLKKDGTKVWYKGKHPHREDGPAVIEADGTKKWFLNGKLHREDGPAVEYPDGTTEWWMNDKQTIGKMAPMEKLNLK